MTKLSTNAAGFIFIIFLSSCANYSNYPSEDYGEDIEYANDGEFGETVEAKQKRLDREISWNEKWGTDEKQRLLLLRNIQNDLVLLGYKVGNTQGIQDKQTNEAIKQFQIKNNVKSPEINEKLEERVHQEAWKVRRADLAKRDLEIKRNVSNRQLFVCNQLLEKKSSKEKHFERYKKQKNKARVFVYRGDNKSQKYPRSRLFLNNKKVTNLESNTFTVLNLEDGQYLLEEKLGVSNNLFGDTHNTPVNIKIESDKTYYIQLIVNRSDDPKFGGSGPVIPLILGGVILFVESGPPQFYTSSFLQQNKEIGECFMIGSKYLESAQ